MTHKTDKIDKTNEVGILDPTGINMNPITNNKYSEKYIELAKKWSILPAYEKRYDILNLIKQNNVILVKSGTGSGKSVLIPKLALHNLNYNKKVIMSLPKQIIAQSSAEYAAATLDVELGKEIGYKFKGSPKNMASDKTLILYATDGTLVNKLLENEMLPEYDCAIIDEAHERKIWRGC
jgi:pre-mRNA-splicing factor ATP-dependent RNA helicase DHX15/PRP43